VALHKAKYGSYYDYSGGVNCYAPGHLIADDECFARRDSYNGTRNVYWDGRVIRRKGSLQVNAAAVGSYCVNAVRFYRSATPQRTTFAAIEETTDTGLYYLNASSVLTKLTGGTAFSTGAMVHFTKWKDSLYCASSTTVMQKVTYSGSWARADITGLTSQPSLIYHHKDRLFAAGGNMAEGYMEACDYDDDTEWAAGNGEAFNVGYKDGDPINRLISLGDDLVVLKNDSIWMLRGDNLYNWYQHREEASHGCVAALSAVDIGFGIVFLSQDNIYYFNGEGIKPIGTNVKPWLDLIPVSLKSKAAACYHDGFYRLAFASSGASTYNDRELWLDVKKFSLTGKPAWWLMDGRKIAAYIPYDGPDEGSNAGLYFADGATAYVRRAAIGTQDDSVDIGAELHSKFYTMQNPNQAKMYGTFKADTGLGIGSVELQILRNLDEGYALQKTLDAAGAGGTLGATTLGTSMWTAQGASRKSFEIPLPSEMDGSAISWQFSHAGDYDDVVFYGASFDWKYKAF